MPEGRTDFDVRLTAAEMLLGHMELREVSGRTVLQAGRFAIDPLAMRLGDGQVGLALHTDATVPEPTLAIVVRGTAVPAKPFLTAAGVPDDVTGSGDVAVDLQAHGRTARALASSLDGRASLALADGDIDNGVLTALFGPVLRAARMGGEFGAGRTAVRCVALDLTASHGDIRIGTLLLDTSRLALQGSGAVRLGDEHLDLRLRPTLRIGGPGVAVPLRVGGSMREPKLSLDAGGALGSLLGGERRTTDGCPAALASARHPAAAP